MSKEISVEYIKKILNNDKPFIIEVGAYNGRDSKEISKKMPKAIINCFECDPRSIELFKKNVGDNPNISLFQCALGNYEGTVDFYPSDSDTRRHSSDQKSWSASSSLRKPKNHLELFPDVYFTKPIKVPIFKLDDFYSDKSVLIDLIWVDVNGAEEDLIRGGMVTLNSKVKYLYIEFSDKELYEGQFTKDEMLKLLDKFELVDTFNFQGNFGNILLKNKKFK